MKYTSDQVKKGYWNSVYSGRVWHWFINGCTLCNIRHPVERFRWASQRPTRKCPKCQAQLSRMGL